MVRRKKCLQIQNVRIKDRGDYYCTVINEWGNKNISDSVQLIVSGKSKNTCDDVNY